jgi:F0F1-type ATP synthase membrane subunit b/b'
MKKIWPGMARILDQHITEIKNTLFEKQSAISEHEKLKSLYQERLQLLDKEIEEMRAAASQKLEFLKIKLDTELEAQYAYRQKSFRQVIHRIQRQQQKILQARCVEEILVDVESELKKNTSFYEEYMVSLLAIDKEHIH